MRKREDFFDVTTLSDAAIEELANFLTVGIDDTAVYDETSKYLIDITNRFKRSGNETTIHISLSEPDEPSERERLELVIHEKEHTQRYGPLHDTKAWETEITFYRDTNRLYTTILGHLNGNIDPLELSGEWEAGYKKAYQAFTQEPMEKKPPKICLVGCHGVPLSTYAGLHRHHGVQSSDPRRQSVVVMPAEEYMEWDDRCRQEPIPFSISHLIPPMSIHDRSDKDGNLNKLYDPSVSLEEIEAAEEIISKPVAEVDLIDFAKGLGTKLKTRVDRDTRAFGGKTQKKKRWNR